MLSTLFLLTHAAGIFAATLNARDQFNEEFYETKDVIETEFAIIGGGAAGTYAAIGLTDQNKTFIMVEISDRLGGHTVAYKDAQEGVVVDFGVQIHLDDAIVRNFFARLNCSLAPVQLKDFGRPAYYDFSEQVDLPNYTPGHAGADYAALFSTYPYVQDLSTLPANVPSELLLNWPEFAKEKNLSYGSTQQGLSWPATPGNPLDTTALAILNDGNLIELAEFAGAGVADASHDNSRIYTNALAELEPFVLLNSHVVAAWRGPTRDCGVKLVVKTPSGLKLVKAKQLILGMPPTLDNMIPFGLDQQEYEILSLISGKHYYGGVVNNTGLEDHVAYTNVGEATPFHVAALPGVVEIAPSAYLGYQFYWYNSETAQTQDQVEAATRSTIRWLQTQSNGTELEPNFLDYSDFSPFHLSPPSHDIENGWYSKMDGLQGYRNTWYIGALYVVGSTQVWNSTHTLLSKIIQATMA